MSCKKVREVVFKANSWSSEDTSDHECIIHLSGLTSKEETVQVKIKGFTPYVYLEIPANKTWNMQKCKCVYNYFRDMMGESGPIRFRLYEKEKLHYKEKINTIMLTFPTGRACRDFAAKAHNYKGHFITGVGRINHGEFKVHEHNIDPIIKYTAKLGIPLANWVKVTESCSESEDESSEQESDDEEIAEDKKFSTADIDLIVKFSDVEEAEDPGIHVQPRYMAFDGEMYSRNHNSKLPDSKIRENKVFQISVIEGRINCPKSERKNKLLTLFDPLPIKGVEIIRCKSEKDLLLTFSSLIREQDPDLFITYNGMKFDWDYMINRAELLGVLPSFLRISRLKREKADLKEVSWESSAYGEQNFRFPECRGRVNVDVLLEVERNYKLPKYNLNYVASNFLNRQKVDLTPRQLFMLYKITEEMLPKVRNKKLKPLELRTMKKRIMDIFPLRLTHGDVRDYRHRLLRATVNNIEELIQEAITIVGDYCNEDSNLTIDLVENLNLTTTMEQMSNVMHVPASYLHTRGQQIKVLAQVYREAINGENNYIIPYKAFGSKNKDDENYQGAVVIEAHPGDYDNVGCLDFKSLYPTTMIALNICYTTIVEDDDPIPDSKCHVLAWEDHIRCIVGTTPVTISGDYSLLIKDMQKNIGKYVHSADENFGGTKLYKQTNFFHQGIKRCVRLTLEDGTILECTPDHKIRTENGWVKAEDIILNKERVLSGYNPPLFVGENAKMKIGGKIFTGLKLHKLAKLLGMICSDGGIYNNHVRISSGHNFDTENICSDIEFVSGTYPTTKKDNYGEYVYVNGWLGKLIRNVPGMMKGNKQTQLRTFPEFLDKAPESVIRSFLSGLFGGDGHTFSFSPKDQSMGTIKLSWSSEKEEYLIPAFEKLKGYLKMCDIDCSITQNKERRMLCIPACDSIKFKEKIGFAYCCHKSMRLEAGCHYLRLRDKVWEQQKKIVENVRTLREKFTSQKKRFNMKELIDEALSEEKFFYNDYYGNPSPSQMTELLRDEKDWSKPMFSRKYFPGPMEFMEQISARGLFSENGETVYGVREESECIPLFKLKVIHREDIGEQEVFDIEVEKSHSFLANGVVAHNCEHDPQKRKKKTKNDKVMCGKHRYRFRKVVIEYDEKTGKITRHNEGVMPRLERNLLTSRGTVKKEMFRAEARLKMQKGEASEKEITLYRKCKIEIIEKGSLGPKEEAMLVVTINVLNAKQLAIKVSANSVTPNTPIPCLVNGRFEYRAIESLFSGDYITDEDGNEVSNPPKNIMVWSDGGWSDIKYVFRHKAPEVLHRVLTHTGCVDVTSDHSLLDNNGKEVKATELEIGEKLLHVETPLPFDTPEKPEYTRLHISDIRSHQISTKEEKEAFVHGLFFAEGTCGTYGSGRDTKNSWCIYNQDNQLLQRSKDYLKDVHSNGFYIYDPGVRSSVLPNGIDHDYHVFHLRTEGDIKSIAEEYRALFYNNRGEKVVPNYIFSSPYKVRLAFFVGYYAGDGNKSADNSIIITNKGQLGSAGLFHLSRSLGYKVSISCPPHKNDLFRLQCCTKIRGYQSDEIKDIREAPRIPPVKKTRKDVIRNGEILEPGENGNYNYKGITYECDCCKKINKCQLCNVNRKGSGPPRNICNCPPEKRYTPRKIEDDKPCEKVEYVYDIETSTHHFAAGVGSMIVHNSAYGAMGAKNGFIPFIPGAASVTAMGRKLIMMAIDKIKKTWANCKLVYGDTDSCMIRFEGVSLQESFNLCEEASKTVTHHLKSWILGLDEEKTVTTNGLKDYTLDKIKINSDEFHKLSHGDKVLVASYESIPIDLEFENMYGRFLLLTKKRYVAFIVNRDGKVTSVVNKGVVIVRRNNCDYLRMAYKELTDAILEKKTEDEVMNKLYDQVQKLFTRKVPDSSLIIYTSVKNVMAYAKKKEKKNKDGNVIGKYHIDEDGEVIDDPVGPLDPRLIYPNLSQCILALKMLSRGTDVPPNTRLEYLYIKNPEAKHEGDRLEDYTYYKEHKDIQDIRPDYLHYLEKQLSKSVAELLSVKYPKENIIYEKLDDALKRLMYNSDLSELKTNRIAKLNKYVKEPKPYQDSMVGWDILKNVEISSDNWNEWIDSRKMKRLESKIYSFRGDRAKVEFIIESSKLGGVNDFNPDKNDEEGELIKICKKWKARVILDKIYNKHGMTKRPSKRPSQTGEKLRKDSMICLAEDVGDHKKGEYAKIIDLREEDADQKLEKSQIITRKGMNVISSAKATNKKAKYLYDLLFEGEKIVNNVPRKSLATFYVRDGNILDDMYKYRRSYQQVVEHINIISTRTITFVE